jgi:nucleotide-binding universal stress UspA family protein
MSLPATAANRETPMRIHRIVVPTDFSPAAEKALDTAIELARVLGATIVVMHSYEIPSYAYLEALATPEFMTALEQAARNALEDSVLTRKGIDVPLVTALYCGTPHEQILVAVQQHAAGLVVMGTHGRRGIAHALLGSVAEKIVRLSPVPVLTVRAP